MRELTPGLLKFMFSKKVIKIDEIFTGDLTLCSKCQIYGEDLINFCGLLKNTLQDPHRSQLTQPQLYHWYYIWRQMTVWAWLMVCSQYSFFFTHLTTEDGRSTSLCLLYGQLSQGLMANFPAFIALKSFDLWNHHIPQTKCRSIRGTSDQLYE